MGDLARSALGHQFMTRFAALRSPHVSLINAWARSALTRRPWRLPAVFDDLSAMVTKTGRTRSSGSRANKRENIGAHISSVIQFHVSGFATRTSLSAMTQAANKSRRQATLSFVVSLAVLALSSSALLAQEQPPIDFVVRSPLPLTDEAAAVEIINNSQAEWQLSIEAFLETPGEVATRTTVDAAGPEAIAPGARAVVRVGPVSVNERVGESGYLVVRASSGGTASIALRPLHVARSTPKPLVDSWEGSNIGVPLPGSPSGLPDLPLAGDSCGALGSAEREVFLRAGSKIDSISYQCVEREESDTSRAVLEFDDDEITSSGEYSGTLDLGGNMVAISYLRTASLYLPILVLLLGIVLGISQHLWINIIRPVSRLDKRISRIVGAALKRQADFRQEAGSAEFAKYDSTKGIAVEAARLQTTLGEILPGGLRIFPAALAWSSDGRQPKFEKVLKDAEKLEDVSVGWPQLAEDFKELDECLEQVSTLSERAPGLLNYARRLACPSDDPEIIEPSFKQIDALRTTIPATVSALGLVQSADDLISKVDYVESNPPDELRDIETFHEARQLSRQIRNQLVSATDTLSIVEGEVESYLKTAHLLVSRVIDPDSVPDVASIVPEEEEPVTTRGRLVSGIAQGLKGIVEVADSPRTVDFFWLTLSVAIAVWSGLTVNYFGKPWGSWFDVIVLAVWTLGATAVLSGLLSALGRLFAGEITLEKDQKEGSSQVTQAT